VPYVTQDDLLKLIDLRTLTALTAEPGTADVDTEKVARACATASDKADNILSRSYTVPLLEPYPSILVTACAHIALFLLLKRPDELRRLNHDDAIRDLKTYAANRQDPAAPATEAGLPGSTTEDEEPLFTPAIMDTW
jgi:phage gp36-like protein